MWEGGERFFGQARSPERKEGRQKYFFLSKDSFVFPCADRAEREDPKQGATVYGAALVPLCPAPERRRTPPPALQYAATGGSPA